MKMIRGKIAQLHSVLRKCWGKILVILALLSLIILTSSNNYTNHDAMFYKGDNSSIVKQTLCNTECQHVVFIKVHKAASTTTMNVMLRFALKRNLTIMLPKASNCISEDVSITNNNILHSKTGKYDILCNHVIYDRKVMSKYFPPDTKYVTILREPFDQFTSGFMYNRDVYPLKYLVNIPGRSPISTFLQNPLKYEPAQLTDSFTNSRMSVDLGIKRTTLSNLTLIKKFVKNISNEFDLVLIAEYYDESMVLLKRTLKWKLEDVLYMSSNSYSKYKNNLNLTTLDRERFRQMAQADCALYQHFYGVFWEKIRQQGSDFFYEVKTFRNLRKATNDFCTQKKNKEEKLILKATEWSDEITIPRTLCTFMMKDEISIMTGIKKNYFKKNKIKISKLPKNINIKKTNNITMHIRPKLAH